MRGKHPVFSEEHNRKISEAKMGHTTSDEARKKMSAAKKGKKIIIVNGKRKFVEPDYVINNGEDK